MSTASRRICTRIWPRPPRRSIASARKSSVPAPRRSPRSTHRCVERLRLQACARMTAARARAWLRDAGPLAAGAFLALQAADRTVPLAWAVLAFGGTVALFGNGIDWRRPVSPIEHALLAVLGACVLSAVWGVDRARSLLLSVPTSGAILFWLLTARAPRRHAAILGVRSGLAIAAGG